MESIALPELYCPFAKIISPHSDSVHEETVEWALKFGLAGADLRFQIDIGRLAGRYHPYASREVLQLVSDLCAWFFVRDDWCDESELGKYPEQLDNWSTRFVEVLEGAELTEYDEPLSFALRNLQQRLWAESPSDLWKRRFIRSVQEHFDAGLWEATNRLSGVMPDLDTYIRMRRRTGGMYVDSDLIEVTDGIRLPPEVLNDSKVRSLREASMDVVVWSNDLLSLQKELMKGEDMHNLVFVVQQVYGLSFQEAVLHVVDMHDSRVRYFMQAERYLPDFGPGINSELERYVDRLRLRMRGNLDWSYEVLRYRVVAQASEKFGLLQPMVAGDQL